MAHTLDVKNFLFEMCDELEWAVAHFPPMNSIHEAYAVILEEVDELWDEARKKPDVRDQANLRKELVQIATMAWRTALDLKLGE